MNYEKIVQKSEKLIATAKDGKTRIDGVEYTFTFDRYNSCYVVKAGDEFIMNLNERTLAKAKMYLAKWLKS